VYECVHVQAKTTSSASTHWICWWRADWLQTSPTPAGGIHTSVRNAARAWRRRRLGKRVSGSLPKSLLLLSFHIIIVIVGWVLAGNEGGGTLLASNLILWSALPQPHTLAQPSKSVLYDRPSRFNITIRPRPNDKYIQHHNQTKWQVYSTSQSGQHLWGLHFVLFSLTEKYFSNSWTLAIVSADGLIWFKRQQDKQGKTQQDKQGGCDNDASLLIHKP